MCSLRLPGQRTGLQDTVTLLDHRHSSMSAVLPQPTSLAPVVWPFSRPVASVTVLSARTDFFEPWFLRRD